MVLKTTAASLVLTEEDRQQVNDIELTLCTLIEQGSEGARWSSFRLLLMHRDVLRHYWDLFQIFLKSQGEKRGKWSSPKPVLSMDKVSQAVTVPGKNGRTVRAAIEDVRLTIADNQLAIKVQEAIDTKDNVLDESISDLNDSHN
eukprot:IDg612t1